MGFYTVTINLLLLNMIIATFSSTVEELDLDSNKIFKFQRFEGIKECSEKTILPPPIVVFEYLYLGFKFLKNYANGIVLQKKDDFRKKISRFNEK